MTPRIESYESPAGAKCINPGPRGKTDVNVGRHPVPHPERRQRCPRPSNCRADHLHRPRPVLKPTAAAAAVAVYHRTNGMEMVTIAIAPVVPFERALIDPHVFTRSAAQAN